VFEITPHALKEIPLGSGLPEPSTANVPPTAVPEGNVEAKLNVPLVSIRSTLGTFQAGGIGVGAVGEPEEAAPELPPVPRADPRRLDFWLQPEKAIRDAIRKHSF